MGGVGRSLSERRQSIELAMRFVSTLAEKETKDSSRLLPTVSVSSTQGGFQVWTLIYTHDSESV
jgi:hypothetical protein